MLVFALVFMYIILTKKREPVANYFYCLLDVVVGLQFVIVVFPDHSHLLCIYITCDVTQMGYSTYWASLYRP